jgi:hypothetical protein
MPAFNAGLTGRPHWGCVGFESELRTLIVNAQNITVWPANGTVGFGGFLQADYAYHLSPYDSNSPEIIFQGPNVPVAAGQTFALIFNEVLTQGTTGDEENSS